MDILKVENLTKRFGDAVAVKGVSLAIERGKVYALIGPNGSGKTTLVKTVAGLLHPSQGKVLVNGADAVRDPVTAKAAIGYIPDEPSVWAGMTGEEFLHFIGALFGVAEAARRERIAALLAKFHLAGIEKGYFEDYSRGNKQKFTIIAALLHEPKLLLVDEPIVGLDPESAEIAKHEFRAFADRGGAVLIVTHTLTVAQEIADMIGVLKNGTLVASAPFADLVRMAKLDTKADLVAVYRALAE
ncbi:MAG TPA: ABC transporter ATP-binding protein [Candidatus Paceibacterota bacterium]|jgi:ABC-2 type transport system ATP-binding protein|nr:ABC transporter ATP-binding protein [Candidatus Paceibacterota bacterium]